MSDETRKARWDRVAERSTVIAFLAALCLPLMDSGFGLDRTQPLAENRALALAPKRPTTLGEWRALPAAYNAYWEDNFGFRKLLLRSHARLRYALGDSPVPSVLRGAQGYYFYAGDEATAQHRGLRTVPEQDLAAWANALRARKKFVDARGGRYVFVVAPDKESVYPELYPAKLNRVGPSFSDRLLAHLRSHTDVTIVDLRPALVAAKSSAPLYFKTDTHWNDRGAYFGYAALMTELQRALPGLPARSLESFVPEPAAPFCGDLAAFSGLERSTEPVTALVAAPPLSALQIDPGLYRPPGTIRYEAFYTPGRTRSAVVFHDSFLLAPEDRDPRRTDACFVRSSPFKLSRLVADSFSRTVLSWHLGGGFSQELIERERPSIVVQEVVERHLIFGPLGDVPAG
jgi:hypothetical protein